MSQALDKREAEYSDVLAQLGSANLTIKEQVKNYTRNEWRRCKTTLETSGEDAKLHSKRVEKMQNDTRNWWRTSTLGQRGSS